MNTIEIKKNAYMSPRAMSESWGVAKTMQNLNGLLAAHGSGPASQINMHFKLCCKSKQRFEPKNKYINKKMTISEPLRQEHPEWHQQYCNNMRVCGI